MAAEDIVESYAGALFIRSEAEIRRPVVLLAGERTNVYGVLEKHFRETALPPAERFWRAVRGRWDPPLDTWRPRVNGVQLKVLAGARLPDSEEEWAALRAALTAVRQHLRSDSSVDRLHAELRDFVGMVVAWWENRKKTENGGGQQLLKRVASAGLLLAPTGLGLPLGKRPCLEYMPLAPGQQLPGQYGASLAQAVPPGAQQPQYHHHNGSIYAAPEIVAHPLLGAGGSGRLPDRLPAPLLGGGMGASEAEALQAAAEEAASPMQGGYLQQLTSSAGDAQLFGQLFGGGGEGARGGSLSPREAGPCSGRINGVLQGQLAERAGGLRQQREAQQHEGSADSDEAAAPREAAAPAPAAATADAAASGKRFVALNVGGHRFATTAATLAAVEGSYLARLARQAGDCELFVDRNGKVFEYVLDYLRCHRFGDPASALPRDERTLCLLAREAAFYRLPDLAQRAQQAVAELAQRAQQAGLAAGPAMEDKDSDAPAHTALDGSIHGSQLALARLAPAGAACAVAAAHAGPPVLDAVFLETGLCELQGLGEAQAALLQKLNATVSLVDSPKRWFKLAAKQADGFSLADVRCGVESDGPMRSLHYHVLLRKAAGAQA